MPDRRTLCLRAALPAGLALILASAVAAQEQYRLGPGDVLGIVVVGHSDLASQGAQEIAVRPDGRVSYPVAGEVEVTGKTTAEVQEAIETALGRLYRHVEVSVNLVKPRERRVYVLGEVKSPGAYDLPHEGIGVWEAVALAGGTTPQAAEANCYLHGRDVDPIRFDLSSILSSADRAAEPRLAPGDTLVVQRRGAVSVVGEVRAPGVYQMDDGATVLEAIAVAGGLTERSDRREAVLLRADERNATVDLAAVLADPASQANAIVGGGDTLVIKEDRNEVAVLGAVGKPGTFYAAAGVSAAHALAMAGGAKPEADLGHAKLVREGREPQLLDLRPLMQPARTTGLETFAAGHDDVVLEHGDALIVPERLDRAIVLGAVRNPGAYPIRPGDRVTDALAAAGGQLVGKARPRDIALIRRDGDRVTAHKIDLRQLLAGRDASQDQPLEDGDMVVVPGAKRVNWREYSWLLFGAASAARYLVDVFQ
jgi:polysaccharide export outer membrane protein